MKDFLRKSRRVLLSVVLSLAMVLSVSVVNNVKVSAEEADLIIKELEIPGVPDFSIQGEVPRDQLIIRKTGLEVKYVYLGWAAEAQGGTQANGAVKYENLASDENEPKSGRNYAFCIAIGSNNIGDTMKVYINKKLYTAVGQKSEHNGDYVYTLYVDLWEKPSEGATCDQKGGTHQEGDTWLYDHCDPNAPEKLRHTVCITCGTPMRYETVPSYVTETKVTTAAPAPAAQPAASAPAQAVAPAVPQTAAPAATEYVVVKGDYLSAIARKNNMSLGKLLELNPQYKANPSLIYPGNVIKLQ